MSARFLRSRRVAMPQCVPVVTQEEVIKQRIQKLLKKSEDEEEQSRYPGDSSSHNNMAIPVQFNDDEGSKHGLNAPRSARHNQTSGFHLPRGFGKRRVKLRPLYSEVYTREFNRHQFGEGASIITRAPMVPQKGRGVDSRVAAVQLRRQQQLHNWQKHINNTYVQRMNGTMHPNTSRPVYPSKTTLRRLAVMERRNRLSQEREMKRLAQNTDLSLDGPAPTQWTDAINESLKNRTDTQNNYVRWAKVEAENDEADGTSNLCVKNINVRKDAVQIPIATPSTPKNQTIQSTTLQVESPMSKSSDWVIVKDPVEGKSSLVAELCVPETEKASSSTLMMKAQQLVLPQLSSARI